MKRAGFVLVGGRSTRMGRDKALLPWRGQILAAHMACVVRTAAGSATLIGPPERYSLLGFPVIADSVPGCGPLGGILSAVSASQAEWNLVVACDMPWLAAPFLASLLEAAEARGVACLAPVTPSGRVQPLCAVYHAAALPLIRQAVVEHRLKMTDLLAELGAFLQPVAEEECFRNLNTPEELLMCG